MNSKPVGWSDSSAATSKLGRRRVERHALRRVIESYDHLATGERYLDVPHTASDRGEVHVEHMPVRKFAGL